jgi:cytochrome c oxidase assembly factor CtaG
MSTTAQAIFSSWSIDPAIAFGLLVAAILYLRGWRILHRTAPAHFPAWRLGAFLGGVAALWIAIASPLDALSGLLLAAHMVQHLMLMFVAPPLILLGSPPLPWLRGLPRTFARDGIGPFLVWPPLRRFARTLTHPVIGWMAMAVSLCAWHVPAAFELALRSPAWHKAEHACFLSASLLFWWSVARPFPTRPHWPAWTIPIYLLAADILNTAVAAILTFSEHALYSPYESAPRLFGTTPLSDQVTAGVIMWVPGSLVYLIPATLIAVQYLSPRRSPARWPGPAGGSASFGATPFRGDTRTRSAGPFDILSVPFLRRVVRARSTRRALQILILVIAMAVMADGFFGPQAAPTNLAGVIPWNWWRALTMIALLAAGNLFCWACPFMLPRELGRFLGLNGRAWPRALRSKWLAAGLVALFFWAGEVLAFRDKPFLTAWLILGYFIAAFVVDTFFHGASFCKYVCPIGQFQFVNSLLSPLEVKVRKLDVCAGCHTHDCLRGNEHQRGCQTELHLPRKVGNLDCTFCLDCVRACPHDNIGLLVVSPGAELLHDPPRSSLGRLSRRADVAVLVLVLVFAAFATAAAMTRPVAEWRDRLTSKMGLASPILVVTFFFVATVVLGPAFAAGVAALSRRVAGTGATSVRKLFGRFSLALVPLGTGMWTAHFLFHLLSSYGAAWPVLERAAADVGLAVRGPPDWALSSCRFSADTVLVLQTLLLDTGLLLTLYVGWRVACDCATKVRNAQKLFLPWAFISAALYTVGIWICMQPMSMPQMAGPETGYLGTNERSALLLGPALA